MEPQLQLLELEPAVSRDDDLSVEHTALRQLRAERDDELGKIAIERLEIAALREDVVAVAEHERAEAVPLRLVDPSRPFRELVTRRGEHRLERRLEREAVHGVRRLAGLEHSLLLRDVVR